MNELLIYTGFFVACQKILSTLLSHTKVSLKNNIVVDLCLLCYSHQSHSILSIFQSSPVQPVGRSSSRSMLSVVVLAPNFPPSSILTSPSDIWVKTDSVTSSSPTFVSLRHPAAQTVAGGSSLHITIKSLGTSVETSYVSVISGYFHLVVILLTFTSDLV